MAGAPAAAVTAAARWRREETKILDLPFGNEPVGRKPQELFLWYLFLLLLQSGMMRICGTV